MERCPSGYNILKEGWQGSGVTISRATDPQPVTTTSSIKVGDREVFSVARSRGGKSGNDTVIKVGEYQTAKTADGNGVTVIRSPRKNLNSQEGTAKYFEFKCK